MTELLIGGLYHDLSKKRSFVHFVWKDDPDNRTTPSRPKREAPASLRRR
jgi:hypothetical protein